MSDSTISVRDSLMAAQTELTDPTPAPEPVITAPIEAAAAAEPNTEAEAKAPAPEGRDDKGRFAPKEPKAPEVVAEANTETAQPVEEEPQETEAIRVPPSLPAAVKAIWKDVPPEVRDAYAKQEESVQTAKAEWGRKGERLNRYDEIIGPHLDQWRLNGLDEFSGVQTLLAAQNILERNPVQGLVHIAKSYGVTASQIAQAVGLPQPSAGQPGAEGQQAPTAQPDLTVALQPYVSRLQALEQERQAEAQRTESEKLASARTEVTDFASKPENMYFENVKADVARRLETGAATTLAEAYEQATWASPEIRPLLLKAQSADAAKSAAAAAAALKAKNAKNASGSVTGAPSPGAVAPTGPPGSVRDSIIAAREQIGAV